MDPELHALLLSVDDPVGCEGPRDGGEGFVELDQSVEAVQARLRDLGVVTTRDRWVQDASFFTDLSITDTPNVHHVMSTPLNIRFSNFGRLCTVTSSRTPFPPEYRLADIVRVLGDAGWRCVPAEQLDEPYDGVNEVLRKMGISWWDRYFDYL